jgi:high-affinity iron transporter
LKGLSWFSNLGLNPTVEAVSMQLLVVLFALATYSVFQRNNRLVRRDKMAGGTGKAP